MRSNDRRQDHFCELLEPELIRLQAFCHRLTGNPESGDDLMQDGLYDAWKGFGRLRQEGAFKGWLYRIIVNRYRTSLRKFRKMENSTLPIAEDIADASQMRVRVARDRLKVAMSTLSASDRALVTLRELEGWSYAELAAMFGRSECSLRTRLARCRCRMREKLRRELERTDEALSKTGVFRRWIVVKQEKS